MSDTLKNDKAAVITLAGIVAWDLAGIFTDAILFAILYRRTGNCLISYVPHFPNNMIGFFLVPVMFG